MAGEEKRLVVIYRSGRREEMYLYTDHAEGMSRVPEALMQQFGQAIEVMKLVLTPKRTLARADASEVLKAIQSQGFYLQMPPPLDEDRLAVVKAREANPAVGRRENGREGI